MKNANDRIGALTLAGALTLVPVTAPVGQGIAPCTHEARFGLVNMARLQSVRVSIVNLAPANPFFPPDPVAPPDPVLPPDPCHVAIGILHPDGEPFVDASGLPIILEQDLRPGESIALELRSSDAFRGSRSLRMALRPTAILSHGPPPDDGAPEACGAVVPTLEVYEPVTGRTQVFSHPSEIFGFNPQPEPPGEPSASRR